MTDAIAKGTAQGSIAYLDSLVDKGRQRPEVVSPLKTALKKILEKTEGADWPLTDIGSIDIADTMGRFKNLTLGNYSQGSYRTYELRLVKAVEWYRTFLERPGWYPAMTDRPAAHQPERLPPENPPATADSSAGQPVSGPAAAATQPAAELLPPNGPTRITYPFPMADGTMASLSLPRSVRRSDVRRLTAFLEALIVEDADDRPS